ncbi:hypothetical protein CY34DRAFT_805971 [Suillus luteus UH-Slu-Lm8-n1]|uniref:Unplaced genomic scaffold CY34scaffold_135, whole genome shotgun sequence n=1 Tax=Suillus luteus UH-Slu-Lm8-n1 TaxID=930992 RepID=A0A0D0AUB3_9AGAM|nr:hypothetical protein CY34DRAFT_805971 [Suillus luteus UH-Slu-Lm8-n1]
MTSVPTPPSPLLVVDLTTTQSNSKSTSSNGQSSSRTSITATGTIPSSGSSSSYANTTSTAGTSSSSSSRIVLSTGARVGLGFGLAFFLILCAILFSYLKRRWQRTREKVNHEPALPAPEVNRFPPSQPIASQGGDLPPPMDAAYPNPQYPFSTPARPASYYSPTYLIPNETSASTTMMTTLNAPAIDSSQPGRQLPAPHADINSTSERTRTEETKF